jgi:DNA helicase HerA-like ATPase
MKNDCSIGIGSRPYSSLAATVGIQSGNFTEAALNDGNVRRSTVPVNRGLAMEYDDQGYVRSLVPESEGDLVSVLAGLSRGEALVLGEAVPLPTRLQFEKPSPRPQ